MSESNYIPDGSGVVMGDRAPMANRGTSTGMTGIKTVTGGMSLNVDAINRIGGLSGTGSDPMFETETQDDPAVGSHSGVDISEDRKGGY